MGKKLNLNEIMEAYEMLSKKEKNIFEKEIQSKKEEQFEILRNDRQERTKLAEEAREAELNEMEKEIVAMLKQALPKVEYLIKYATFEGDILHVWKYMRNWRFKRPNSRRGEVYEFYYNSSYHYSSGKIASDYVGIGYIRGKGFSFIYDRDDRPCERIRNQHEAVCKYLKMLDEEYDEIIKKIDDKVDSIISGRRHGDRDAKSCYKF